MADFRMKLITLAGVATAFAGMAYGQINAAGATCTTSTNAVFVAAEGTTEQVADTTISCPASTNATGGILNLQVYLSPSVSITSVVLGTGGSAKSETLAGIGVLGGTLAPVTASPTPTVWGSVSGSSVSFNGITVPATAFTVTITNIKINASQIATSSGAPTAVTETIFIGGTNVTPAVLSAVNVAFATNALANISASGFGNNGSVNSVAICTGVQAFLGGNASATGNSFNVNFAEGFATAFKTGGLNTTNATLGSEFANNTYTGYGATANGVTNTANSGTRIMLAFNNIPANVTIFAPLTVPSGNGGVLTQTASATALFTPVTGSTANGAPGATGSNSGGDGRAAVLTVSNGSATAVYEETTNASGAVETYAVPIYLQASGSGVAAPSSAITVTVSFAPIGASNTPNYVSGSSTATKNATAFTACSSTMLFPFVTNQAGFETGIAIANMGNDLLKSATSSSVTGQSGTCTLTFFGNATASANPPAFTTASNVVPGTDWTGTLTSVTGGTPNTFSGYMIASCNFLYGHGFSYITYNIGQSSGMAMGYLALEVASPRAGATPGAPESLNN